MREKRDTDRRRTPFSFLKAFCNVAGAAFWCLDSTAFCGRLPTRGHWNCEWARFSATRNDDDKGNEMHPFRASCPLVVLAGFLKLFILGLSRLGSLQVRRDRRGGGAWSVKASFRRECRPQVGNKIATHTSVSPARKCEKKNEFC